MVESDFAAHLVKVGTQETDVAAEYEKITQENKAMKTSKEKKESKLTKNGQLEVLKNKIKDLHKTFDSLANRTRHGRVG